MCDDDEDLGPSQESKAQSTRAWDSDQEDEGDRLEQKGSIPIQECKVGTFAALQGLWGDTYGLAIIKVTSFPLRDCICIV